MNHKVGRDSGTKVSFGDVVKLSKERSKTPEMDGFDRYVGLEHLEPGNLKIRSWGDVADGTTFTNIFKPGQVLFGKRRAYQRKLAVADFSGVCSGDIYVLEPKNDMLLPELLPFICQTDWFFKHAVETSAGSLSPRTNWKHLAALEFNIPSLEEQRRIVEVLMATETLLDRFHRLSNNYEILRKSLLKELLGPRENWIKTTIGDIAQVVGGGTPSTSKSAYWNGHIPWFTPTEIVSAIDHTVSDSERKITDSGLKNSSARLLPPGAVLLTTRATIGATAIATRPVSTNQGFQSLIPSEHTSSEFLMFWCQNSLQKMLSRASGSTFLEISGNEIRKLEVSLPQLSEQREIIRQINQFDESRKKHTHLIQVLSALKRTNDFHYFDGSIS